MVSHALTTTEQRKITMTHTRKQVQLRSQRMTFAGLYLALAIVLPFLTGQIPEIGAMLCPMHIPTLLCGFVCGWPWGLAVGFVAPLLRSVMFGMPTLFPTAVAMAFELAAYGALAGVLNRRLPHFKGRLYISLLIAMVLGRIVWGAVQFTIAGISHTSFSLEMFLAGAITSSLPGMILQLVLIPPLVAIMDKAGLDLNQPA